MMSSGINRRDFMAGVAGTSVAALSVEKLAGQEAKPDFIKKTQVRPNFIAVSTYSYWRYRDDSKLGIEECIDLAADAGGHWGPRFAGPCDPCTPRAASERIFPACSLVPPQEAGDEATSADAWQASALPLPLLLGSLSIRGCRSDKSRCQRETGSFSARWPNTAFARPRLPSAFSKSIGLTL